MLIYRLLSVIFIGTLSDRGIIRANWCKVTKKINNFHVIRKNM